MAGKKAVPRVRFSRDYTYTPSADRRTARKYRADGGPAKDGVYPMNDEGAEQAVAAGAAVLVKPEKPDDRSGEAQGAGDVPGAGD